MTEETISVDAAQALVARRFESAGIAPVAIDVRRYPEETIFLVQVVPHALEAAARIGNEADGELADRGFNGFVTVRVAPKAKIVDDARKRFTGVHDDRATELVRLLQSHSRTSEVQPSLSYVPDFTAGIEKATAPRHHLVFGRRGAGKTALMIEAKQRVQEDGHLTAWVNLQPYRWMQWPRAAVAVLQSIVDSALLAYADSERVPSTVREASELNQEFHRKLALKEVESAYVRKLLPRFQRFIRRFLDSSGQTLYVFLDDFYFIDRGDQVELLDALHACIRDSRTWLKLATIRHLTRWFEPSRQLGLQLGHDADTIDLDVTLEQPTRAKEFLETVLRRHALQAGVTSLSGLFSPPALDRLVLASGAVPRDYLLLASEATLKAQARPNARLVGVQDVNKAAGHAAQLKLQELDEDLTPETDWAARTHGALDEVLKFCLDETKWTFFRVDFRQRDENSVAYDLVASLMDLRLIHLLTSSLSDEHHAGEKSEVYLLDLSQYSGDRLKKFLHVLDFDGGHLVLKETGRATPDRVGDTARKLVALLRRGPMLDLDRLAEAVTQHRMHQGPTATRSRSLTNR
jgi:hypothetical protein